MYIYRKRFELYIDLYLLLTWIFGTTGADLSFIWICICLLTWTFGTTGADLSFICICMCCLHGPLDLPVLI